MGFEGSQSGSENLTNHILVVWMAVIVNKAKL